jgi:hypothetical protein
MKSSLVKPVCLVFALLLAFISFQANSASSDGRPIPCRIRDGANPDLFIMTLGDVKTPLTQGWFDPAKDQVRLTSGTILDHYYRDTLGIKYYQPIDKANFPVPASGWCSWYYYFYEINEDEIKKNAKWMADNLKDYGLTYVQIDDGWEGIGHGYGENRDWTTINERFPGGMEALAAYIKQLGFKPALWIAPHGQSNPKVVKAHPNAFLLKPDGTTLSDTWEGNFLVDPSTAEGHAYLKDLFTTLTKWGYDYFKIDGQPCVVDEYKRLAGQMKNPSKEPDALYRKTLQTIHETIGSRRYLLGCWEIPLEGVGLVDGWRTGADVVPGWLGFRIALDATMQWYFLHNVVWYCDSDNIMVHNPLTIEQARGWATLQGLTGQALMSSDRMMDLSSERVELYKRIYPAVDIRPLDLFPSATHKPIWDLKVKHLGRSYDVAGLFNFGEHSNQQIYLNWSELGIAGDQPVHVYDFWNKEYVGVYRKGYSTVVGPTSCKVLTLLPATSDIQLISTSRHLTQGWVDLLSLEYEAGKSSFKGRSRVIKDDPYALTFVFPPGKNFAVTQAKAGGLPVKVANHQGWATVEFTPGRTEDISWTVGFAPEPWYHFPSANPGRASVVLTGLDRVAVKWDQPGVSSVGAFLVSLDGELLGATKDFSFPLRNLSFGKSYSVQVVSVWDDGSCGTNRTEALTFTLDSLLRRGYSLTELEPIRPAANQIAEGIRVNQSAFGKALAVGGKKFDLGLGAKTDSTIEYNLYGLFEEFTALAGVDDNGKDSVVIFTVEGDGKELWNSGEVTKAGGAKPISVAVRGVKKLVLRAVDAGGKKSGNAVDWCEPAVRRK